MKKINKRTARLTPRSLIIIAIDMLCFSGLYALLCLLMHAYGIITPQAPVEAG